MHLSLHILGNHHLLSEHKLQWELLKASPLPIGTGQLLGQVIPISVCVLNMPSQAARIKAQAEMLKP